MTTTVRPLVCVLVLLLPAAASARDYAFDGRMSETVLRNYLSRASTLGELLTEKGNFDDNLRMLKHTGAKFAGRSLFMWGGEGRLPEYLEMARKNAAKVHAADPEVILQACVFEIVSREVERNAVPAWAFEALGMPVERRNFRYEEMLYPDGHFKDHWRRDSSVPDISRTETKLWFYTLAASYIDVGIEAIHFGQVELMNHGDRKNEHWRQLLTLVRQYAAKHARRRFIVCDGHVPGGGLLYGDRLLLDFHSFPLRTAEIADRPQHAELRIGFTDAIYGRSRGGLTPSGWKCEHLPFLVELDNWGPSGRPGQANVGGCWTWGYDEITWFSQQPRQYRNDWLRYAWKWVRENDPAGYLQMPGIRCLAGAADGKTWYYANTPSDKTPQGFGQEETIREIWAADR